MGTLPDSNRQTPLLAFQHFSTSACQHFAIAEMLTG
jgi:hypothetical protein